MMQLVEDCPGAAIQLLVERILTAGKLSQREHLRLTSTLLVDNDLNDEDRRYINRILDYVQIGRLQLVD
jgi:hypothetical protein